MLRILALTAALLCGAAVYSPSALAEDGDAPSTRSELASTVAELLQQLDSPRLADRRAAEQELLDLGPKVLPLFPAPERLASVSVREAVRRVRTALEREAALESVAASRVSLEGMYRLAELLQAVRQQTENPIDASQVPADRLESTLQVAYSRAVFWRVLEDVCRQANLRPAAEPIQGSLALLPLKPGEDFNQKATIAGAFRVAIESCELQALPGNDAQRRLRVRFEMRAEPRLRPLFAKFTGRDLEAKNAEGRSLAAFSPDASLELPLTEAGRPLRTHVDFIVAGDEQLERVSFRGRINVLTAARSERFTFAELRAGRVSRRHGGVAVAVEHVTERSDAEQKRQLDVELTVSYDRGGPAFESHRTWMFHNDVWLESADRKRIPPAGGFETRLQADGAVRLVYHFTQLAADLDDYQFVYAAPTLLVEVPVEFAFDAVEIDPRR